MRRECGKIGGGLVENFTEWLFLEVEEWIKEMKNDEGGRKKFGIYDVVEFLGGDFCRRFCVVRIFLNINKEE